jgi:flagellar FliJ protein
MKKFKFSLEALLNHRIRKEQELQKEVSLCEYEVINEKSILLQIKHDITKTYDELNYKQTNRMEISEHIRYINFISRLNNSILIQEDKITKVENKFILKREELIEAVKKRKVVDNLKEKKLLAYKDEQQKEEQNFMDEVGIYCFNNKNSIYN